MSLRLVIRRIVLAVARTVGTPLADCENGEPLGRALIIPWRGKIHIVGLGKAVRVVFLPQARITYWKQELGFTLHPPPDFPREHSEEKRR